MTTSAYPTHYADKVAAPNKTQFLMWWKQHTNSYPIRSARGVVDATGLCTLTEHGFNIRNCHFQITDFKSEKIPFKLNSVDHFTIVMPELKSLENCPADAVLSAQYGSITMPMRYMDNLRGTVFRTKSMAVVTEMPIGNLENRLVDDVEDITIVAPMILDFVGLTQVKVARLTLNVQKQKTFKGINKAIKGNVKALSIGVGPDFAGGVLPFAMMDDSVLVLPEVAGNPPVGFKQAMDVVAEGRIDGLNVHDIQEKLIDIGLGKYAQL